jgi:hypothetical protein
MNQPERHGVQRGGIEAAFEAEETRKSNLLLQVGLLRSQDNTEETASLCAEVAEIEERLSAWCAEMVCRTRLLCMASAQ